MQSSQRQPGNGNFWIIAVFAVTVTLWSGSIATVYGAPAKLDSNETPLPLELQAPLVADAATYDDNDAAFGGNGRSTAFDSYGNPIEALQPIETPDGRKVVSAQGLQFEIPNYASGITEIRKPAEDLLPPFIDPIAVAVPNDYSVEVSTTGTGGETTTVDVENAQLIELTPDYQQRVQDQQQQSASVHAPKIVEATATPSPFSSSKQVPSYLLDLNDPDIGGPVDYVPSEDGTSLKVIAWDLLPPYPDNEPVIITKEHNPPKHVVGVVDPKTQNIKVSLNSGQGFNPYINLNSVPSEGKVTTVELEKPTSNDNHYTTPGSINHAGTSGSGERIQVSLGTRSNTNLRQPTGSSVELSGNAADKDYVDATTKRTNQFNQRGNIYYTNATPRSTTTRRTTRTPTSTTTTTTTTTQRPTTTTTRATTTSRATTTTRSPTTVRATTTIARTTQFITTTEAPLDPSQFYKLAAGDSYTLPSWLADFEDPDLDAAVTFIVPEDLNEYNHTISRDLEPPLEPFVDLNNIHLTAPASATTTKSPPTTTTRRTTIRTTTTRRPTVPTPKSHWVRANPTTTTPKPISNDRFTSPNFAPTHNAPTGPSSTFTNFKSSTPVSTTTTTPKTKTTNTPPLHQLSFNELNPNLPTVTVDPITSSKTETTPAPMLRINPANPFLRSFNPKPFSTNSGSTSPPTTSSTTSTTTTTTTTPAPTPSVYVNPFDSATIPSWLSDIDYPELGPGVPFNYDPADPELAVANNLQPPSTLEAQATNSAKPVFVTTSPTSFNSFQATPQGFQHKTSSLSTSSSSSSFPSKVTLTLPSIQTSSQNNQNAAAQPPNVFIPPPPAAADGETLNFNADNSNTNANARPSQNPSSSFNKNFAAPFDSNVVGPTTPPNQFDQETFPPFATRDDSVATKKTTFTKSGDGKVLTNNLFLQGAAGTQQQTTKPFGNGNVFTSNKNDFQAAQTNQFLSGTTSAFGSATTNSIQSTNGFAAGGSSFTSSKTSAPSGFVNRASSTSFGGSGFVSSSGFASTTASTGDGKYRGGFGGAPGVLGNGNVGFGAQQTNGGSIQSSVTAGGATFAQQQPKPAFTGFTSQSAAQPAASNANRYSGRFGGPPGILNPYDNVKGGQA